jgi:hypothetical protein
MIYPHGESSSIFAIMEMEKGNDNEDGSIMHAFIIHTRSWPTGRVHSGRCDCLNSSIYNGG